MLPKSPWVLPFSSAIHRDVTTTGGLRPARFIFHHTNEVQMSDVASTETASKVKTEIPKEPDHILKLADFQISDYAYADFAVTLPVGWTLDDAMKPEFWVQVCHKLQREAVTNEPDKAGAIIRVRTRDHAFYAELYVRAVQERGLLVSVLREPMYFGPREVPDTSQFEARWNVGKRGFDVIRKSDREIVADGAKIKTREMAQEWIDRTLRN